MRIAFGKWLVAKATIDPSIVVIVGDNGYSSFKEFMALFPERFLNVGICEQAMVGIAAGMALSGMKPYVFTITPFLLERAFEQIKLDVDAQKTNVKLVGYSDYDREGISHVALNVEETLKLFPNLKTCFPKNVKELYDCLDVTYKEGGPSFMYLTRGK